MDNLTQGYSAYEQAYVYLNATLFDGQLPACLITFQRKRNAAGYYAPERFVYRGNDAERTGEIALNPDTFKYLDDKEILSILAHEMARLWQAHHGAPGREGIRDRGAAQI